MNDTPEETQTEAQKETADLINLGEDTQEPKPEDGDNGLINLDGVGGDSKEETPKEEIQDPVAYDWNPPEEFKANWDSLGEDGKKEFDDFKSFANQHGIKPEAFNGLMDKYMAQSQKISQGHEKSLAGQWTETLQGWHKSIKDDKEVGGAKYGESLKIAGAAILELGGNELKQELSQTGFGNNPHLFKALVRAGNMLKEGAFVKGGVVKAPTELYEKLYKPKD